mgnify:FL=1|tara:strand:+ start:1510 stop:1689 length:180 start_codon:yes stop_codon:yes gene_type:complete
MHEFFTLQELKELQSSFKYGSYSSKGDPDQPIVRKSILRKIEKAIEVKTGLMRHFNSSD